MEAPDCGGALLPSALAMEGSVEGKVPQGSFLLRLLSICQVFTYHFTNPRDRGAGRLQT